MSNGDPTHSLRELGPIALLGSDRGGAAASAPSTLLSRVAVATLRARAGRRGLGQHEKVSPCPEETRPVASATQCALLDRFVSSSDASLIEEWCTLAVERGVLVPALTAPVLLEWWARQPTRSEAVFGALGARGPWLASLNPEWKKPVATADIPSDADEVWQTGSGSERGALLAGVHRLDPQRALLMVQSTWGSDGAEERKRFVAVLGRSPMADFEPFLEAALDDRSKLVRQEAATALARLPSSALRTRMRERATAMVVVTAGKSGLLRKSKPAGRIEPPATFDKAWERDGIEDRAVAGRGKRASWMMQVLSMTGLETWTETSGLSSAAFLEALRKDEYFADLLYAFAQSAGLMSGEPAAGEWAVALVSELTARRDASGFELLAPVWRALSREMSESLRVRFAAGSAFQDPGSLVAVLTSDARGWTAQYSVKAIAMCGRMAWKKVGEWEFRELAKALSRLVHPEAAAEFEQFVADKRTADVDRSVEESVERVKLRAEMHREMRA